ncbi:Aste57867_20934 [Aphanomyces stellatus]|uniref:Aste57867_20934 protein n=1 Tax=Aphanomyces stellatus TaxID=120398 RepID=A0A485LGB9_9STRA|nr:hypothetical protein As57867_020866 [Aphanomyces stellatus]VFT97611.1 Aste57867_20934 [Aphanomyces stellatus]
MLKAGGTSFDHKTNGHDVAVSHLKPFVTIGMPRASDASESALPQRKPPVPKFRTKKKETAAAVADYGSRTSTLALVLQRAKGKDNQTSVVVSPVQAWSPRHSLHILNPSRKTPAVSSPRKSSSILTKPDTSFRKASMGSRASRGSISPRRSVSPRHSMSPRHRQSSSYPRPPSLVSWCPSEPELDEDTLWENTHSDIAKLQSKLDVKERVSFAPVAPHAFGCRECGSKDLTAFCWKGCRNFTPLGEFYDVNETLVERQEQLEATVYAQGVALHTTETNLVRQQEKGIHLRGIVLQKEQQQSLHMLQHEIFRLSEWVKTQRGSSSVHASADSNRTFLAVKAMLYRFDLDGDGVLSMTEMNRLKAALGHKNSYTPESFDHLLVTHKLPSRPVRCMAQHDEGMQLGLTPEGLLKLYEVVGGSMLVQDLHTLGIHIGRTHEHAVSLEESHALLMELKGDLVVRFARCLICGLNRMCQAAMESQKQLRVEVEDKTRTLARVRDNVQTMTSGAMQHEEELNVAKNEKKRIQEELKTLKQTFDEYVHTNNHSKLEMASSQQAALEMRTLLENQIEETEQWQRHCWELQEQLNAATSTCNVHKQKLWQTKEAKKHEERKNMLLYMQAQQGKKHTQQT